MTVYVDRMHRRALGLTFTAHMIADSTEELDAMAARIGLRPAWRQRAGTHAEHYDLTEPKRRLAVRHGAVEITSRELGHMLSRRLEAMREVRDA